MWAANQQRACSEAVLPNPPSPFDDGLRGGSPAASRLTARGASCADRDLQQGWLGRRARSKRVRRYHRSSLRQAGLWPRCPNPAAAAPPLGRGSWGGGGSLPSLLGAAMRPAAAPPSERRELFSGSSHRWGGRRGQRRSSPAPREVFWKNLLRPLASRPTAPACAGARSLAADGRRYGEGTAPTPEPLRTPRRGCSRAVPAARARQGLRRSECKGIAGHVEPRTPGRGGAHMRPSGMGLVRGRRPRARGAQARTISRGVPRGGLAARAFALWRDATA
eukprot:scaffold6585_cov403-Prasinococcus_capsulatus_cf.AAC.1